MSRPTNLQITLHHLSKIRMNRQPSNTQRHTNTQIQIHKYTDTACAEVPERPNMWYIFAKRVVQGYQKLYSNVPNAQIQNTNTENTANTANHKVPERPNIWHIFEKRIVQGYQKLYFHVPNAQIQNFEKRIVQGYQKLYPHVPNAQMKKYKYKIHKYSI